MKSQLNLPIPNRVLFTFQFHGHLFAGFSLLLSCRIRSRQRNGFFFHLPFLHDEPKKKKTKIRFLTPLCISCMTQICLLSFLIWFYCIKMWPDLAIDFRTYFKFFVFALSVSNFFLPLFPFFLFILEFSLLASLYFQLQLGTVGIKLRYWFFLYSIGPADNRS